MVKENKTALSLFTLQLLVLTGLLKLNLNIDPWKNSQYLKFKEIGKWGKI